MKESVFKERKQIFYGGHSDEINCLVLSEDLEILLTGSIEGCIRVWNTVFEHLTCEIDENEGLIRALAISKNDRFFASTADDNKVRLYQTRNSSLIFTLTGHSRVSDCLEFSSDSRLIASGSWNCQTILWDVFTGEQIYNFQHHTNAIQSISFHPTLNMMATGSYDYTVLLYNFNQTSTLSKPITLKGHLGNVRTLAFSRHSYLASAGWDKIIVVWNIDLNRMRARLFGHNGWIQAITFPKGEDDDGSLLASADDEAVHVWNISTNECLHRLTILNDLSCFLRFLPENNGLTIGGAIYEFFADNEMTKDERTQTKRVRKPLTGEDVMMSREKSFVRPQRRHGKSIAPVLKQRPKTVFTSVSNRIK